MHFNLEEQEQIAEIKAWWRKYGNWLLIVIAACLLSYGSYVTFNWWQLRQSQSASKLYDTLLVLAQKQDVSGTLRVANDIQHQYSSTSYAGMSGLVAAQIADSAGDMNSAELNLRWTMNKAKSEAHGDLARIRLIALVIDKGDFAEAEKLANVNVSKAFMPLLFERRGDIQLAQQKNSEARKAYLEAWDLIEKNPEAADEAKRLLKVKLDAVGGR